MFIPMTGIIALALFGGFLLWVHTEETKAKRRNDERERQSARQEADRLAKARKPTQP